MSNRRCATQLICSGCGQLSDNWDRIPHYFARGLVYVERCRDCIIRREQLCEMTLTGIHSEIITPDEDDIWDERVVIPCTDGLVDSQYGYCRNCRWPFFWNPELHRWVPMTIKDSDLVWRAA